MSKLTKKEKEAEEKEKKIQIAVRFLMNPDLASAGNEMKKNFLKKKGNAIKWLNDDDIKKAFELVEEKKKEQQQQQQQQQQQAGNKTTIATKQLSEEDLNSMLEKANQSKLISLKYLDIRQVDSRIFDLENLKMLILSYNQLEIIPDEISKLKNLEIFHAAGCKLQNYQISDKFWELSSLVQINLSRNGIVYIDQLPQLENLQVADLSHNEIMDIPENIEKLGELKLLNLDANNISAIPIESLRQLKKLKKLGLLYNLLDDPNNVLKTRNPELILQI